MIFNQAAHSLMHGNKYPYDAGPVVDWAHAAARGVLADLCDRGGIKHQFGMIDDAEIRSDIVAALAAIIREANKPGSEPPIVATAKTLRDEFAMAALSAIVVNEGDSFMYDFTAGKVGERAYEIAEAMMKARSQ